MALKLNTERGVLGGVCAGIADALGIDTFIPRLIFVLLFLSGGSGIAIYVILWIIMKLNETGEQ